MKIQCGVCEAAEAQVVCCADEAVLCAGCHLKIHAKNKLAAKHQRLPLSASAMPRCDICRFEGNGDGVSKWSRILKSVEEVHDENLGDPDNISWTVPESLPTHHPVLDTDYDAISTDTMEMELNNVAHLPNFGFLTIDDHLQQQQQYQHNPISRKRQRDELRRET